MAAQGVAIVTVAVGRGMGEGEEWPDNETGLSAAEQKE